MQLTLWQLNGGNHIFTESTTFYMLLGDEADYDEGLVIVRV